MCILQERLDLPVQIPHPVRASCQSPYSLAHATLSQIPHGLPGRKCWIFELISAHSFADDFIIYLECNIAINVRLWAAIYSWIVVKLGKLTSQNSNRALQTVTELSDTKALIFWNLNYVFSCKVSGTFRAPLTRYANETSSQEQGIK